MMATGEICAWRDFISEIQFNKINNQQRCEQLVGIHRSTYVCMHVSLFYLFDFKNYYLGKADVELKLFLPSHYKLLVRDSW